MRNGHDRVHGALCVHHFEAPSGADYQGDPDEPQHRTDRDEEHDAGFWRADRLLSPTVSKLATSSTGCGTHLCPVRNDALMLGNGHGPTIQVVLVGLAGLIVFAGGPGVARCQILRVPAELAVELSER
jgi:hypothetical protein